MNFLKFKNCKPDPSFSLTRLQDIRGFLKEIGNFLGI
jgi:hypothetical protein